MVANTLSKLNDNRKCFRKIGDNLVEKDLDTVKKDLKIEIANIKQTLDVVYKTMVQQENILNEYENIIYMVQFKFHRVFYNYDSLPFRNGPRQGIQKSRFS